MDPGEKLFQGLVRLWRRARHDPDPPRPGAAQLADHTDRLELLGALLLGALPEIKPADDEGALIGNALLLPRRIQLFDEASDNERVFHYRLAFAAAARELDMDAAPPDDGPAGALATLLAVPTILDHLHATYPATEPLTRRLAAAELASRPPVREPTTRGAFDALAHVRLNQASGLSGATERPGPDDGPDPIRDWVARAAARRDAVPADVNRAARHLWLDLCRLAPQEGDRMPGVTIWGRLSPPPAATDELAQGTDAATTGSQGDERRVVELDRTIRLRRGKLGPREDKPLFHVFEKLETAEDYAGQSATPDASGNIEHMKDAIDELTLGTAIRTPDDPRNLVRAEVLVDPGGIDVAAGVVPVDGRVFRYPEWHHRQGAYRDDWVTLVEERLVAGPAGPANAAVARELLGVRRRHVEDIRGHLLRTLHQRQVRNRQTDGPEVDVEAMVERHADLVAGHTPTERLYLGSRRALREIAILVLLDTSYSTDAWLDGRRVLDVEIESLLILSAALEGLVEDEVAVASFRSHTRNDVRFGVLKGFEDSWAHLRRVAPGLEPVGYTRIGAALRHATAILDEARARKKLLLLVSDGKPTDYDRYEGRYGIEDVSKAVREAGQRRIHTFGLAVEKEAKLHLARMLGPGSYRVLPRTAMLPDVMADVFLRMLTG